MWGVAEWTAAATVANVVLVVILVGATIYYARKTNDLVEEQRLDRATSFLPLFHWQSPRAACGSSTERDVIRRQLNIVLWNIGNGAARVTLATASNSEGTGYRIAQFGTPSIVPAQEQLTLRLFRDQTMEEIIRTHDSNFLRDEEITLSFHYSDVVERRHYETHVVARCHFADAIGGKMKSMPMPPEAPEGLSGFEVRAVLAFADPRTAQERLVENCEPCARIA